MKSILDESLLMEKINMDQLDGQSYMPGGNHLSNTDFRIETAVMAAAMAAERGRKRRKRNINRTRRRRRLDLYRSSW